MNVSFKRWRIEFQGSRVLNPRKVELGGNLPLLGSLGSGYKDIIH